MIPSSACPSWPPDQSGQAGERGDHPAAVTPRDGTRPSLIPPQVLEVTNVKTYTARITHRDGSVDEMNLGICVDHGEATRKARAALFVSLSARSVDLFDHETRVAHLRRDIPTFRPPFEPRRLSPAMPRA